MSLGGLVRAVWGNPLARGLDVDGAEAIRVHRRIIESNPFLKAHHLYFYRECLPAVRETAGLDGPMVEIGSGAGTLEEVVPGVVKTDSVPNPYAERVVDAMRLDYPDESLRALFLLGVLHHVPEPGRFIAEAQRCLKPGGRLVMLEPNNSLPQRLLCRLLDHYEYFDDAVAEWKNAPASGRMTKANLALPWVMVVRDRERFEREFPRLRVKALRCHTFLRYILSGGMSYRPFLPPFALPLVEGLEALAGPFMRRLGTVMTIDIVKT